MGMHKYGHENPYYLQVCINLDMKTLNIYGFTGMYKSGHENP